MAFEEEFAIEEENLRRYYVMPNAMLTHKSHTLCFAAPFRRS